jgi:hypothetical protein
MWNHAHVRGKKWYNPVLAGFLIAVSLLAFGSVIYEFQPVAVQVGQGERVTTLRGKPIVEQDGRTLLWGGVERGSNEVKWWDVTDADIDVEKFDHGLGADRIPSIDGPKFAKFEDSVYSRSADSLTMEVIGVEIEGEARAYPIRVMSRHELVNDVFGEAHVTVAW